MKFQTMLATLAGQPETAACNTYGYIPNCDDRSSRADIIRAGSLTVQSLIRRVDLFTLKLFLTAIEEGQIGRAAAREFIAPSAATKRIQDLEDIAGLKLFERNAKGVIPSQAGLVFARHIRVVLATLDDMRCEIANFGTGVRGHIGIAAPGSLIVKFLAEQIGSFNHRFPLVNIELREETNSSALRALTSGDVDIAIFSGSLDTHDDEVESYEFHNDRLVAVVPTSHPLAKVPCVSLDQLLNYDLIGLDPRTTVMINFRHAAQKLGRDPEVKYSVRTVEAARSLVSAGLGVTLQPASMELVANCERITTVALEGKWAERSHRIGKRNGKPLSPAAAALFDQIKSLSCISADEPLRKAKTTRTRCTPAPSLRKLAADCCSASLG